MKHPSVLVLIADDWSPLARCYGHADVHTPRINGFAREATVFHQASCTTPSCAASRANLLTGLYSHSHGQYGHCHGFHGFRTHEYVRSLPAVLKTTGVRSGLVGKHHIAPMSVYPFDHSDDAQPWRIDTLEASASRFLKESSGRPFYLQVASMYPHRTNDSRFDVSMGEDALRAADVRVDPAALTVPGFLPDTPEVRQDLADYYRFVARYDRFIGAMLDVLDASGRREDTLVVVMSDHGMPFPGAKGSFYEAGHRCPLLIRDPRRNAHADCHGLVNWSNLAPTFYEWLNVEPPTGLPECSLLPLLEDVDASGFDRVFYSHSFHEVTNFQPYRVVRDRRYKLVRHLSHGLPGLGAMPLDLFDSPTWQAVQQRGITRLGQRPLSDLLDPPFESFYDLQADPVEAHNLIADPQHQPRIQELRQELASFRERTRDPWLRWDLQTGRA